MPEFVRVRSAMNGHGRYGTIQRLTVEEEHSMINPVYYLEFIEDEELRLLCW